MKNYPVCKVKMRETPQTLNPLWTKNSLIMQLSSRSALFAKTILQRNQITRILEI